MNHRHFFRFRGTPIWRIALAAIAVTTVAPAGEVPRIDAVQAAKIATDYLRTLGPGAPYIVSVTFDKSALVSGKSSWVARWSNAIIADGSRELGLRVNQDGSTARLVEARTAARRRRGDFGGL